MVITDRIAHYLLRRLHHEGLRHIYHQAEGAGLIESRFITEADDQSGVVWRVTDDTRSRITGNPRDDQALVARMLRVRSRRNAAGLGASSDGGIDPHTVRSGPRNRLLGLVPAAGAPNHSPVETSPAPEQASTVGEASHQTTQPGDVDLLPLIRRYAPRPNVADAAVALLVARAVGESGLTVERLLAVLRQSAPLIVIQIPVQEFEQRLDRQLERGMILPTKLTCINGFTSFLPEGTLRGSRRSKFSVATFPGRDIREKSAKFVGNSLTLATLTPKLPVLIIDETGSSLHPLAAAGADLVLKCDGIDQSLLIELLHVCCGIPPRVSWAALEASRFEPAKLGLNDLTLALRPGRSVKEIIAVLSQLQSCVDEEEDASSTKGKDAGGNRNGGGKKAIANPAYDRIESIAPTDDIAVGSSKKTGRILLVEHLSGYGDAKDWALNLKSDLTLWVGDKLAWPEMSTRLLLSGPPGTGKTTFARALGNTLQIPLLATSVGRWLEPGYLGDVLKTMVATFDAAVQSAPCILFIDEIDNIGRRSNSPRDHADYWDTLINRMLELLDGASSRDGVVIVGATNIPDKIDPALLRSGRLERHITIPKPDRNALAGILAHHLGADLRTVLATRPSVQLHEIEAGTSSTSGHPTGAKA